MDHCMLIHFQRFNCSGITIDSLHQQVCNISFCLHSNYDTETIWQIFVAQHVDVEFGHFSFDCFNFIYDRIFVTNHKNAIQFKIKILFQSQRVIKNEKLHHRSHHVFHIIIRIYDVKIECGANTNRMSLKCGRWQYIDFHDLLNFDSERAKASHCTRNHPKNVFVALSNHQIATQYRITLPCLLFSEVNSKSRYYMYYTVLNKVSSGM